MDLVFLIAAGLAVVAALVAVTRENPIYAALFTLVALGAVAVEFGLLHAPFLAAMQILLYAGAIMVLFVFVIMLLALNKEEHGEEPPLATRAFAAVVAGLVFLVLANASRSYPGYSPEGAPRPIVKGQSFTATEDKVDESMPLQVGANGRPERLEFGSAAHFGHFLYGSHAVGFELVSVLLTSAMAGVIVLARRKPRAPDPEPVTGAPAPLETAGHH